MSSPPIASSAAGAESASTAHVYAGKRVVVTGALGFIGASLVRTLADVDCELVRVARRAAPACKGVARIIDITGDVRDPVTWARALGKAEFVFHLAAQTGAAAADADRRADHEANVAPMLHLLDLCRGMERAPVVVFAGSVTQAGRSDRPYAPDDPQSVYDEHKLAAERHLEGRARGGSVRGVTLRLSNVYGAGPRGSSPERGVLNAMIARAIAGETLPVYGSGAYLRDYLHVKDAARAFLAAGESIHAVNAGHYVVATGRSHSIAEAFNLVAARVTARTGRPVGVVHVEPPAALSALQSRSFVADPSRFTAATGWRAEWTLAAGVDQTLEEMLCASP